MLLGVDDTDSLKGGCTTHVAVQLALRLRERLGLVLLDHPRLVRLNPSNPWKTRGNAALALRLGDPGGEPLTIGSWSSRPLVAYPEGGDVPPSKEVLEVAWNVVEELTWREDGRTNPGVVISPGPAPVVWYQQALHELLEVGPVEERLPAHGVLAMGEGSRRGLIGAAAAIAWSGDPHTWELLAYRSRDRWGSPRDIDPSSVRPIEGAVPSTFDCHDPATGGLTMVPHSPCPVLYGIRGTSADDLPAAQGMVRGEEAEGWVVFRTNQATDDHLVPAAIPDARPYENVALPGRVSREPVTITGGHVLLELEGGGGRIEAAAYEPTKGFRDTVRLLRTGDEVVACGSVRDEPRTLNVEKLRVLSLGSTTEAVKVGNPRCPECGRSMKSTGAGAGFRCLACGKRAREEDAEVEHRQRELGPGWYEVPPSARRHLARPLRLGVVDRIGSIP